MADAVLLLRAVADGTRQRLLQVLSRHELSVSELVEILDLPQSTVSRHLKVLRESGWVTDRRVGTAVRYAAVPFEPMNEGVSGHPVQERDRGGAEAVRGWQDGLVPLRDRLLDWLARQPLDGPAQRRLGEVVRRRADPDRFFNVAGKRWDRLRIEAFGEFFHLEALTALLPYDWHVADVGTGTGYLLGVLADRFRKVIAVDPSEAMLDLARSRPELAGRENVEFRVGSAERLPIVDGELDLAIASLVLHHLPEPASALSEFRRCLRVGGRLLVIEQEPHRDAGFHERMGDLWWGFAADTLRDQVRSAGFGDVRVWPLALTGGAGRGRVQAPPLFALVAERVGEG